MEKYIFDERNGLWYELQGDYYLPCLKLPEGEQQPVGLWGQRHLRYIKQNRKVFYHNLLTSGKLNGYLLFNLHHSVTNTDMRLDVLGRIGVLFQLFAECCHKNTQGSNIVIPTAAPNVLGNKGMG